MSELSKQALKVDNNQSFPNNNNGAITPSILRAFNVNMIDSNVNQTSFDNFSSSVASEFASITASVDPSITGSSLITASFNNGTRNLTFTKGDSTTFNVNIPDVSGSTLPSGLLSSSVTNFVDYSASVDARILAITGSSINTGSFATTGSNTFIGTQTISGSVLPQVDGQGDLGNNTFKWNSVTVNGTVNATSINAGGGRSALGTVRFGDETFPLQFVADREIVADGSGANTHMYYATSSSDVNGLREFVYTQSGSNADFGQVSASFNTRIDNIVAGTGFATTGSNTFYGNQTIATGNFQMGNGFTITAPSGDITNLAASNTIQFITEGAPGPGGVNDIKFINRVTGSKIIFENTQQGQGNGIEFTAGYASFDIGVRSGSTGIVSFGSNTTAIEALSTPIKAQRLELSGPLTASLQQGYVWVGNSSGITTLVATSSFGSGGNFATTGSNTFTGDQTLIDAAGNTITLSDVSGSLILVAKTFTSASAHLSGSGGNQVNLIFKNNNNTADTIISGSNNIFTNPNAPTAGFKRYATTGNLFLNPLLPQISASMQFSPAITNNVAAGGSIIMRGPVSASIMQSNNNVLAGGTISIGSSATLHAERLTFQTAVSNNVVAGGLTVIANQSNISSVSNIQQNNVNGFATLNLSSSAVAFSANSVNDGNFTLINQFSSGSLGNGQASISANTISGNGHIIYVTGSQLGGGAAATVNQNLLLGTSNTLFVNASESRISGSNLYQNALATGLIGQRLIVTGSSNSTDFSSYGSLFVGRNNADDGRRNKSSDVVFAVGTGISSSADTRKTGFLIDSGSNTFVEGTFNVSGSTSLTGSLTIQSGSSFFANGNKQFNVGAFSSTITQSGSANVSQSVTFNTTDKSEGVSIVSNSQITLANSGTYSITFSAQCDPLTGAGDLYIWLKKNGTNVANSATKLSLANNDSQLMTVNFVVDAVANDYYELGWQSDSGDIILEAETASGNIPAIPSVILTVTQVR